MKQAKRHVFISVVSFVLFLSFLINSFFARRLHIEHKNFLTYNYFTDLESKEKPLNSLAFKRWQIISGHQEVVDIKLPYGISYKDIKDIRISQVKADLQRYSGKMRRIAWLMAPMPSKNYYYGKFENGKASAEIINKYTKSIEPGGYFYLLRGNPPRMHITPAYGFVRTSKGFGMGACWGVSVLGGLIDRANYWFKRRYGVFLFIVLEKHSHSRKYAIYQNINGGYGYAIWESPNNIWDYRFVVNPYVKTFIRSVKIKLFSTTNYKKAYKGRAIGGAVEIVYNSKDVRF